MSPAELGRTWASITGFAGRNIIAFAGEQIRDMPPWANAPIVRANMSCPYRFDLAAASFRGKTSVVAAV